MHRLTIAASDVIDLPDSVATAGALADDTVGDDIIAVIIAIATG